MSQLRAADKNLEITGNPLPSYTILNAFSDAHLSSILNDCGVAVDASVVKILSLVRAREIAQAAIAEAAAASAAAQAAQV